MYSSTLGVLTYRDRKIHSFCKNWELQRLKRSVDRLLRIMGYNSCETSFVTMIEFVSQKPVRFDYRRK